MCAHVHPTVLLVRSISRRTGAAAATARPILCVGTFHATVFVVRNTVRTSGAARLLFSWLCLEPAALSGGGTVLLHLPLHACPNVRASLSSVALLILLVAVSSAGTAS